MQLVFLAAEEERTLGSWAFAKTLAPGPGLLVVNLEAIGASGTLAFVPEDGFALRRWTSPPEAVAFVNEAARARLGRVHSSSLRKVRTASTSPIAAKATMQSPGR